MMSHETLDNYYKINFVMTFHHKYSLTELENMLPWERQIYVGLIQNHLQEEKERQRDLAAVQKAKNELNGRRTATS